MDSQLYILWANDTFSFTIKNIMDNRCIIFYLMVQIFII